jgi:hypothetical protein
MTSDIFFDIECFPNFFFVGMKRREDGKRIGFELSERRNTFDRDRIRRLLLKTRHIGYHSLTYDLPMLWYALDENVTNAILKEKSNGIIQGNLRWWDVDDYLGIRVPWDVRNRHIDLIEPQPNAFASLKALNGRMHGEHLQDLPYQHDTVLTDAQMDVVAEYCLHRDLDATENLWNTLAEPMALREALGAQHGQNFMSKSDSQIGEAIVKKRVEEITGTKPQRIETKPGTTFFYPVPEWMKFETSALQSFLEEVRQAQFVIGADGKVKSPKALKDVRVKLGNMEYSVGIGGLHSTEAHRPVKSDQDWQLVDADVASQYPSIILMLGLFPKSLGAPFLEAYRAIRDERLKAKKRAKEIKKELPGVNDPDRIAELKRELEICTVKDKGGKIQLNGVYGKLGSKYSILYAPHLLIGVTLTGQLTLLMLIEKALAAGIDVVSGNTDGVLFRCPRAKYAGLDGDRLLPSALKNVCDWWEKVTGFDLEFGEYDSVYSSSVNTYYAIKPNGGHKRKGPIGNPWSSHPDDFDPVRGQLTKNPQMTICSDAALAKIKHGTPVEETIYNCRDMKQFVTVIAASSGATWREEYLGRVVRYYWCKNGEAVLRAEANDSGTFARVQKTEGAGACMKLPNEMPDDIDYQRYIDEAESILRDVGFYGAIIPKRKPIRLTKKNKVPVLSTWMQVA